MRGSLPGYAATLAGATAFSRYILRVKRLLSTLALLVSCGACGGGDPAPTIDAAVAAADAFGPRADARPVFDGPVVADARLLDAGPDASPLVLECRALRARYTGLVAGLATGCASPADCRVLGKNQNASCGAFPMLASRCDGDGVNAGAYAPVAAELDALAAEFEGKCVVADLCPASDLGCASRCSPMVDVGCVHNICSPFTPVCVPP
jgi:hypothetical protein